MEWIKWVFSGIGTWLLSAFGKALHRDTDDNRGGKRIRFKQIQKGGNSSELEQIYTINSSQTAEHNEEEDTIVVQKQIAGSNSKQIQIGVIKK